MKYNFIQIILQYNDVLLFCTMLNVFIESNKYKNINNNKQNKSIF